MVQVSVGIPEDVFSALLKQEAEGGPSVGQAITEAIKSSLALVVDPPQGPKDEEPVPRGE